MVNGNSHGMLRNMPDRFDDLGGKTAVMNHIKMVNNNDPPKHVI